MTVNQFFRVLTFLLGVFIFPALLAIGVWAVKQYGMVLDMSAMAFTGLGEFGQSSSGAYQGAPAGALSMTSVLTSLYSFSLMMTFTLLRHKPNYLAMLGVTTILAVSLAFTIRAADWLTVVTLTPAFLFLLAWGVAIGPAWDSG